MGITVGNILNMRAPFGGQRSAAASRVLGPGEAKDTLNVWTIDGDIRVRPPLRSIEAAHTFANTPAWPLRIQPIYKSGITAGPVYDTFEFYIDTSGVYRAKIFNVNSATDNNYSGWGTPTMDIVWRVGVAAFDNMTFVMGATAANSLKFYYSSGWQTARVGAASPSAATLAQSATGSLTVGNTYSYVLTYYNSTTGTESNRSDRASLTLTAGNGRITLTLPGASADAQIDKIRIYRREDPIDDAHYFLAEVTDATASYIDDGSVTVTKTFDYVAPAYGFGITSAIYECFEYKGRMWYAVGSAIVHSEFQKPEEVNAANSYETSSDAGDVVVRGVATDSAAFILKHRSIDILTGDSPESFALSRLATGIGCVSQNSVVTIKNRVFFASQDGIYQINGGQLDELPMTDPVKDVWKTIVECGLISAAHIPGTTCIAFSYTTNFLSTGTGRPNLPASDATFKQLIYDYVRDVWTIWDLSARGLGTRYEFGNEAGVDVDSINLVTENNVSGGSNRYKLDYLKPTQNTGGDWNTTAIAWRWETGDFDFLSPRQKHAYYATVLWQKDSNADSQTIGLEWFKDQATSATSSDSWASNQSVAKGKAKIGAEFDTLRLKLSGSSNHQLRVCGIDIEIENVGPR